MFTVREYQGRVNGIYRSKVLTVDGISGPQTREWIAKAVKTKKVRRKQDLFNRGVRGIVMHWTAGANGLIELEKNAYNFLYTNSGEVHDGNSTVAEQVAYNWSKKVGASHTRSMNTGWIGCSLDAMAGATQADPTGGSATITWEGVDAMLEHVMELCEEYDVPVSRWTTLTHAEVQQTLGVKQKNKWDYMFLPEDKSGFQDAVEVGDRMRDRMLRKFG